MIIHFAIHYIKLIINACHVKICFIERTHDQNISEYLELLVVLNSQLLYLLDLSENFASITKLSMKGTCIGQYL